MREDLAQERSLHMENFYELNINFSIDNIIFHTVFLSEGTFRAAVPTHAHSSESYELHFIIDGKGSVLIDDTAYELSKGAVFVTGPSISHTQIPDKKDPMSEYNLYLTVEIPHEYISDKNSIADIFIHTPFWIGKDCDFAFQCIHSIFSELEHKELSYTDMISNFFQQLIIFLSRMYAKSQHIDTISKNPLAYSPSRRQFLSIEQYFLNNLSTLCISELAEILGLSGRHTERLLKKYYGKTFGEMKMDARMAAATLMLSNYSLSLDVISEQLGYSSSSYFSNVFKSYYGISPSKFRKENHPG
jgi:AraC-like DNA-binding protein/mannose-6-phosphate isomerase-like protein (cupin superfamily)